jgi:hypothetical protein
MKKNNLVILCLRLMAIYFLVLGLGSLPSVTSIFFTSTEGPLYFFLGPTLYVLSGIVLFGCAPGLSRFMIEFSETDEND